VVKGGVWKRGRHVGVEREWWRRVERGKEMGLGLV